MSQATGGQAISDGSFASDVPPLLNALDDQWELTIASPTVHDGKLHPLTVKDANKHVQISSPAHLELP